MAQQILVKKIQTQNFIKISLMRYRCSVRVSRLACEWTDRQHEVHIRFWQMVCERALKKLEDQITKF
jgi:hypothetical protein